MPVTLSCTPLHEVRPAAEACQNSILVRIQATDPAATRTVPLALVILLDTSGSMEGPRLAAAVEGICGALAALPPSDTVAVLGFDSRARILVPRRPIGSVDTIADDLRRIRAGGATRLAAGLDLALAQFRTAHQPHALRRLLLLSDGAPSHRPRTLEGFAGHIDALRAEGVSVSTVGMGQDFDEALLAGLAAATGGRFAFVPAREDPAPALTDIVGALGGLALAGGTLTVRTLRWSRLDDGEGVRELPLPDLPAGHRLQVVLPLAHEPRPQGDYVVATVAVRGTDGATGQPLELAREALVAFWPSPVTDRPPNAEVSTAGLVRGGEGILVRTMAEARSRRINRALVVTRLEAAGAAFAAGGRHDLAERAAALADRVAEGSAGDPNKWLTGIVLDARFGPVP